MEKKKLNLYIDNEIYRKLERLSKEMNICRSKIVENLVRGFKNG